MRDVKKVVEWLCCYCTRGRLEEIAQDNGFKNVVRMSRSKLESIAYIDSILLVPFADKYAVAEVTTGDVLVKRCSRKSLIDYVLRECHFNWYDEMELPIHKQSHCELKVIALQEKK